MFLGKKINITENRAVLHTALRDKDKKAVLLDGVDYRLEIESVYQKMFTFANKVINGEIVGVTNKKFKYVVNVGIGGSNLGVMMLDNALSHYNVSGIKNFFLSNIDSVNLDFILPQINLEETIFIIASKTFTTIETIENAKLLKKIVVEKLGESAINKHFVAISTNLKETSKFGINDSYVFGFWDFVGGRYSMWSAISLCLILSIGVDNFKEFLLGGSLMD
jgi:glucose-6-phosphate isomerase